MSIRTLLKKRREIIGFNVSQITKRRKTGTEWLICVSNYFILCTDMFTVASILHTLSPSLFLHRYRSSIQWVSWVKRLGREADRSSPSSAEVKEWVELYLHSSSTPSWCGKGKVVPVLFFFSVEHHAMKAYWGGGGGIAPRVLDLGTKWRWAVSFTHLSLYPRERAPGTHWIGGWVGPRAGLDKVVERKILIPCRDSNPPII
jgi:hypothetical protein